MRGVALLSDTTYPREAVEQLDRLLGDRNAPFPVKSAQIYGLRQIARQQPDKVKAFADHQLERAARDNEKDFWQLVGNLCSHSTSSWSVLKEAQAYLPVELRAENIPARQPGMTPEERRQRNQRRKQQQTWLEEHWTPEHIPAFFERFCTEALYRIGMAANSEEE